jgi:hypothetical protein
MKLKPLERQNGEIGKMIREARTQWRTEKKKDISNN